MKMRSIGKIVRRAEQQPGPWSQELIVLKSLLPLDVSPTLQHLKECFDHVHTDFLHWSVGCPMEFIGDPNKYLPICLQAVHACSCDYDIVIRCVARGIILYIFPYQFIDDITLKIDMSRPHTIDDIFVRKALSFVETAAQRRKYM
jgi:hypothetical protein